MLWQKLIGSEANTVKSPPYYVSKATFTGGTGSFSISALGSLLNGDCVLLLIESANESVDTPSGFTLLGSAGTGTANTPGGVRITVFYRYITSSQADSVTAITDMGNHQAAAKLLFRGCQTTSAPKFATATQDTSASTWTLPAITTTADNSLVVLCIGVDRDLAGSSNVSGWTNTNLLSLTEREDNSIGSGVGGGVALADGVLEVAGSSGITTATPADAGVAAFLTLALVPA
jgi:hypothetical protein